MKQEGVKTSDILSFSSALVVVVTSAIFYLAGWFYLAHWYAYFGIDATQINLPTQTVIIHGLPSILILVLAGLSSLFLVAFWKLIKNAKKLEKKDFPTIVIMAYIIAFLLMGITTIMYVFYTNSSIPAEVIFALVLSFVLVIIIWQLNLFSSYILGETQVSIPGFPLSIAVPRAYAINKLIAKSIREKKYSQALRLGANFAANQIDIVDFISLGFIKSTNLDFLNLTKIDDDVESEIQSAEEDFIRLAKSQKSQLKGAFTETWQFWVGAVLILYLLVSISTSAVFGEWDAARGGRLLVGDWAIPEISLYSATSIKSLTKYEIVLTTINTITTTTTTDTIAITTITDTSNTEFRYDLLGFLASTDKVYYFVDMKTADYYKTKPNVYIIPRSDSLMLNFIVSPYIPPTPTSIPTNNITPTLSPIVTITPTP